MNRLPTKNIFKNNAKSSNKIKFVVYEGVLYGNITEPKYPPLCGQDSLDFSCPENSQYLPLIS